MVFDSSSIVLQANGFEAFNPMQKKCEEKGFKKSLVVSAPTASGKTIIAELFSIETILNEGKKVIYTCPLRALASEHYKDFKKKYSKQGSSEKIKFALSTGDLDSSSSHLKSFDLIMTTYEKLASLLRHKSEWLNSVGCIIIDEMHELDSDRGVVLEIALTQLRMLNPKIKILGLSATIPNAKELANWINADLVESSYRPTKLKEGVHFEGVAEYNDKTIEEGDVEKLIEKNLGEKKQVLVFLSSRKKAEGYAKKISSLTKKFLDEKEEIQLNETSKKITNALESPTTQCTTLAECINLGSAFHHAGLVSEQREEVEESFKKGKIKVLCSTTTLSAGINTPADLVIIPSLYRFEKYGMELISVREYKQCAGRSGRPKFSNEGKSIVIANSFNQKETYLEKFVNGEVEQVLSQLGIIPILRTHILALIATDYINDLKSAEIFFEKTLYAFQLQKMSELLHNVVGIIEELKEYGFVEVSEEKFYATKIGKRVSDLFLDPFSAHELINAIKKKKTFTPFSYFYTWVNCTEFAPPLSVSKQLTPLIMEELSQRIDEIPFPQEKVLFDYNSNEKIFSAMMLMEWVKEKKEEELFQEYSLAPGTLFGKNKIIEWLAYSTIELSKVVGEERHLIPVEKLSRRVKYGVKEELLLLVELKGVGRVRARKLFNAGIKSPAQIKNNIEKTELILGKKITQDLIKQLKIKKEN
ncbi:MAG: DEAD/DEAH box helicase [Candidatus Iainarchaeum sp.]|jgi:helicase